MNSFAFRAATFALVVLGLVTWGFNGVFQLVDVKYGICESHYKRYVVKPFLYPVFCSVLKLKPCGDFAEHRNMEQHIQMYECLCTDPFGNLPKLREYSALHLQSELGTDPDNICLHRPRNHSL